MATLRRKQESSDETRECWTWNSVSTKECGHRPWFRVGRVEALRGPPERGAASNRVGRVEASWRASQSLDPPYTAVCEVPLHGGPRKASTRPTRRFARCRFMAGLAKPRPALHGGLRGTASWRASQCLDPPYAESKERMPGTKSDKTRLSCLPPNLGQADQHSRA